jgi:hypothetical protein
VTERAAERGAYPALPLSKESVLRRADRTAWQSFDNRVVVLDIPSRTLFGLNPTASRVWQQLDGARSLDAIAQLIAHTYGEPQARVCRELIAFAEELISRGCIEQVTQPSAAASHA